jgi:hypothetical protein
MTSFFRIYYFLDEKRFYYKKLSQFLLKVAETIRWVHRNIGEDIWFVKEKEKQVCLLFASRSEFIYFIHIYVRAHSLTVPFCLDKPYCTANQKVIYGVSEGETAYIACQLDSFPKAEKILWYMNTTSGT